MTRFGEIFEVRNYRTTRNVFKVAKIVRQFFAISICVTTALIISGCGERIAPTEKAANEDRLIIGNAADPSTLDPSLMTGMVESRILNGLFEGLATADSSTLKVMPATAESWTISKDGLKYIFKISQKSKWSDGKRVSAKDFEFAWKRTLSPKLGAEYASLLFPIKNAKNYNIGKLKNADDIGVRALDDATLEVELEKPNPYFLSLLYLAAYFPLPQHILKKFGAEDSRNATWTKPKNLVGNGAFTLEKWSINDRVVLKKNPNFRNAKNIFLKEIVFLPISNINTEDRAFRAGQLHITESVAPSRLEKIAKTSPQTLRKDKWIGVYYYLINASQAPLNNPKIRKALAMSIDRRAIIDAFLKADQPAAFSFIPEGLGEYKLGASAKFSENITLAKRILEEEGYPNGKNFPTIKITYNTSEQHKPIAEAIQQMWKKNLGINAELYNLSWPAFLSARRSGDYDVARSSWIGDYAAPESFLEIFVSDNGLNHTKYSNKSFDKKMELASSAKNDKERFKLLSEAEAILLKDMPIIPIYFYSKVFRISPLVEGWHENILDYRNYVGVKLRKTKEEK